MPVAFPHMVTNVLNGTLDADSIILIQCTDKIMSLPKIEEIENALSEAGSVHHEYKQVVLKGVRDELWPGFYAAYVLGKLGNFTKPSIVSGLLEAAPDSDSWAKAASKYVLRKLSD